VLLLGLPIAVPDLSAREGLDTWRFDQVAIVESADSTQQPATLVLRGTIKNYDTASKILQLSTANGTTEFTILPAVPIRQRWHRIDATTLAKYMGYRAAVRYSESGAEKTVQSVNIFGKDERAQ